MTIYVRIIVFNTIIKQTKSRDEIYNFYYILEPTQSLSFYSHCRYSRGREDMLGYKQIPFSLK